MNSHQIRSSFFTFFEQRGHRIVPSAPVIPHGDPTLLFTNAGMNQFKDVFLGTGTRDYKRAVDTQKCIRVSGKHNDLEEVGRDTYHHTFFEMLGNWSFGDYYKKEAIAWAWELLTTVWGLEKKRLYATVYQDDDEAAGYWRTETDIDPSHIQKFGKKDNFWEMGDTGPCGPCSEIHVDLTPDFTGEKLVNAGDPRVMEIWNLVFIQNNRKADGTLERLPAVHVDTGMGFERICAVLQKKSSNYDTDLFLPIITEISRVTGRDYSDPENQIPIRVLADHIRMLTFAITDGAIPGNEGRGYVLRRILRRAARFGRKLGMHEPFIFSLARSVSSTMGTAFPELRDSLPHVEKVIRAEEESFNLTLDKGLEIFESVAATIGAGRAFPGGEAFKLYDTYGFPLDLTDVLAEERGIKVDHDSFDVLMEQQRERSRGATSAGKSVEQEVPDDIHIEGSGGIFVGYDSLTTSATILGAKEKSAILSESPFYAESGGQVSDTGTLTVGTRKYAVVDVRKRQGTSVILLNESVEGLVGKPATASVDEARRRNIEGNHSATHLIHEALRRVLGTHVHQQGSLVAPDRLRFDFPHFGKITPDELRAIEDLVNEKIVENILVHTEADVPIDEARKIPHVKMFFGEKYGERVRVVFIDESFSVEFCGGTHVRSTTEIGPLKIISEGSIASGVRRIEAVSGDAIRTYIDGQIAKLNDMDQKLDELLREKELFEKELKRTLTSGGARLEPLRAESMRITLPEIRNVEERVKQSENVVEDTAREVADLRKEASRNVVLEAGSKIEEMVQKSISVNGFQMVSARVQASDLEQLKALGDTLRGRLKSGVGVLASVIDEKAMLVCVVTDDLVKAKNLQAGKIVAELAKKLGGGGGGKPHLATAGGRDIAMLDEVLHGAEAVVRSMIH